MQSHSCLEETGRESFDSDAQKRRQAHRAEGNMKAEHRDAAMQL